MAKIMFPLFSVLIFLFVTVSGTELNADNVFCPYIYSYDGDNYVLDAEPLARAISLELQRTDWCHLEYLKESKGEYELLLTNGPGEIDYIDELKLRVIDHPEETQIISDSDGNMFAFSKIQPPLAVINSRGENILEPFKKMDHFLWDSGLKKSCIHKKKFDYKEVLIFEFKKPDGILEGKLVFSGRNSLMGAITLTEYFKRINKESDSHINVKKNVLNRDELCSLNIQMATSKGWVTVGKIQADPPMISHPKYHKINLADVSGDKIRIKLTPPLGFWMIDFVGIDFSDPVKLKISDLKPKTIQNQKHGYSVNLIKNIDEKYLILSQEDGFMYVLFVPPPASSGLERSIFLKTTGYYDVVSPCHLKVEENFLDKVQNMPGYLVKQLKKFEKDLRSSKKNEAQKAVVIPPSTSKL